MTKTIMVQGTMSNVGKSVITAGLCRVFARDGFKTSPFKGQNMALNSYITTEGLEMGRAQVMQAEAAGVIPVSDMNPILLKPSSDTGSQVIINGKVHANMDARAYFAYKKELVPVVRSSFTRLAKASDIVVIEGAGSPAEINLKNTDYFVNMDMAAIANAPVLLVGDIDRGGVFAQLYGTIALLNQEERSRIKGIIINKFRGDPALMQDGIRMLEEKCRVPVVGMLPYFSHSLEDEDSLSERLVYHGKDRSKHVVIGIVAYPRMSNFTDFTVFDTLDGVIVEYIRTKERLGQCDLVILPGSKDTIGDLRWMKENGISSMLQKLSGEKMPVFGICGGYQMLGEEISDPYHTESGGRETGLGLLPVQTVLQKEKTTTQVEGKITQQEGLFRVLDGMHIRGYEIHMGYTDTGKIPSFTQLREWNSPRHAAVEKADGAVCGEIAGTYVHGFFDADQIAYTLCRELAEKKGISLNMKDTNLNDFKEKQFQLLEDMIRTHLDMETIYGMLGEFKGESYD